METQSRSSSQARSPTESEAREGRGNHQRWAFLLSRFDQAAPYLTALERRP